MLLVFGLNTNHLFIDFTTNIQLINIHFRITSYLNEYMESHNHNKKVMQFIWPTIIMNLKKKINQFIWPTIIMNFAQM